MTYPQDLKTLGLTHFSFHSNHALFRTNAGVPVTTALSHASQLLHISRLLIADTSAARDPDLRSCASQYLQELSKALIDDAVKVLDSPKPKP
ncbi:MULTISPECIES: DUF3077 domain-containing protein [unclassified Pseudomonas]|uniref:DUF3077 domain-containing protein n=1 Tax=unclassified Pseudomonas TaxID=196821 RepID=UPI000A1DE10E|nr:MULTISPECIES: DUF3077 domain-containing protein [unclassified Pseudomonas]